MSSNVLKSTGVKGNKKVDELLTQLKEEVGEEQLVEMLSQLKTKVRSPNKARGNVLFQDTCLLFHLLEGTWKALGKVTLEVTSDEHGHFVLVGHDSQSHTLVTYQDIPTESTLSRTETNVRSWTWLGAEAKNYEQSPPKQPFSAKFRTTEGAGKFQVAYEQACRHNLQQESREEQPFSAYTGEDSLSSQLQRAEATRLGSSLTADSFSAQPFSFSFSPPPSAASSFHLPVSLPAAGSPFAAASSSSSTLSTSSSAFLTSPSSTFAWAPPALESASPPPNPFALGPQTSFASALPSAASPSAPNPFSLPPAGPGSANSSPAKLAASAAKAGASGGVGYHVTDTVDSAAAKDAEPDSADNADKAHEDAEAECSREFAAVVSLQATAVDNGEHQERIFHKAECVLFRFSEGEWKERGRGEVKLLQHLTSGKVRVVLRENKTLKLRLNHFVQPAVSLLPQGDKGKAWTWMAHDFGENEDGALSKFAVRLATVEVAAEFKRKMEEAKKINATAQPKASSDTTTATAPLTQPASSASSAAAAMSSSSSSSSKGPSASQSAASSSTAPKADAAKAKAKEVDVAKAKEADAAKAKSKEVDAAKAKEADAAKAKEADAAKAKEADAEHEAFEEESTATYQPVVSLQPVPVDSGEQHEAALWTGECKLFRFSSATSAWAERGRGTLKLMKHKSTERVRCILREAKTLKLRLNHYVNPEAALRAQSDKAWTWGAVDFAEESEQGCEEVFAVRFADLPQAQGFQKCYEEARECNRKLIPPPAQTTDLTHAPSVSASTSASTSSAPVSAPTSASTSTAPVSAAASTTTSTPASTSGAAAASAGGNGVTEGAWGIPSKLDFTHRQEGVDWANARAASWHSSTALSSGEPFSFSSSSSSSSPALGGPFSSSPALGGPFSFASAAALSEPFSFSFSTATSTATTASFDFSSAAAAAAGGGGGKEANTREKAALSSSSPAKPPGDGRNPSKAEAVPDHEEDVEREPEVEFKRLVELKPVHVDAGESQETPIFRGECRLYRFDAAENGWKERGRGELKLLKKNDSGIVRCVLREGKTLKLRVNHNVEPSIELRFQSDVSWTWAATDYGEDEDGKNEIFAVKFSNNKALAEEFKQKFEAAREANRAHGATGSPEPPSSTFPLPPVSCSTVPTSVAPLQTAPLSANKQQKETAPRKSSDKPEEQPFSYNFDSALQLPTSSFLKAPFDAPVAFPFAAMPNFSVPLAFSTPSFAGDHTQLFATALATSQNPTTGTKASAPNVEFVAPEPIKPVFSSPTDTLSQTPPTTAAKSTGTVGDLDQDSKVTLDPLYHLEKLDASLDDELDLDKRALADPRLTSDAKFAEATKTFAHDDLRSLTLMRSTAQHHYLSAMALISLPFDPKFRSRAMPQVATALKVSTGKDDDVKAAKKALYLMAAYTTRDNLSKLEDYVSQKSIKA